METARVMTFNVRVDETSDGDDAWPHRRHLVAGTIRYHAPAVVGVQEVLPHQRRELDAMLPGYEWVGDHRLATPSAGESVVVGYRTDRFEVLDADTFWLSETPGEPGSVGWDADHPRVTTVVRLGDLQTDATLVHANTHLDHVGERARREGIALTLDRVDALVDGDPAVVTGDFNCLPGDPPYEAVAEYELFDGRGFSDAKDRAAEGHHGPSTTRTDFHDLEPGRTIDHVFATDDVRVRRHAALTDRGDERYPSDHLPAVADLELR